MTKAEAWAVWEAATMEANMKVVRQLTSGGVPLNQLTAQGSFDVWWNAREEVKG